MNSNVKTAIFWVVLICVAVLLWAVVRNGNRRVDRPLSFSQFINEVEAGRVKTVAVTGNEVRGTFKDDNVGFKTLIPSNYPDLYKTMKERSVDVDIKEPSSSSSYISILINAIPFILLLAFWLFMMRQMQSGGNKALSFGKSRAFQKSNIARKLIQTIGIMSLNR